MTADAIRTVLSRVGIDVPPATIASWPLEARQDVVVWACCRHGKAEDARIAVPARPTVLASDQELLDVQDVTDDEFECEADEAEDEES